MKTRITTIILIVGLLNLAALIILILGFDRTKKNIDVTEVANESFNDNNFFDFNDTISIRSEYFMKRLAFAALLKSSDSIKPSDAQKFTGWFRTAKSFRIPTCWQFDQGDLLTLATVGDSVRFYCGVKPDDNTQDVTDSILCLIAVAVDKDNCIIHIIQQGQPCMNLLNLVLLNVVRLTPS
jgi:hypothetical protein